jgi:hypothetical protein
VPGGSLPVVHLTGLRRDGDGKSPIARLVQPGL